MLLQAVIAVQVASIHVRPAWYLGGSLFSEGRDAREVLALKKFQAGTSASAAVGDFVLGVVLLAGSGSITATNDSDHTLRGGLDNGVHELLGASFEFGHLENAHWAVPNDGLGLHDRLGVELDGRRAAVQSHEAVRDACLLCGFLDLTIFAEFGRDHKVHRKDEFHTKFRSLLQNLRHDLGSLLIVERSADGHAVPDLQEGVSHATSNDDLVHLVQHVHDELNLVAHLGSSQDSKDGSCRRVQDLCKGRELLAHEVASALRVEALSDHGAVCTVRSAESIIAVDICKLTDGGAECCGLFLVGFDLVAFSVNTLAFLLHMEAKVFKQNHRASRRVSAGGLNLCTTTVLAESHRLPKLLLEDLGHWCQGELLDDRAIRTTEMGSQDYGLGSLIQDLLDSGQSTVNTLSVGNDGRVLLILRHVEVHSHENALAGNVHIVNGELGWHDVLSFAWR
mmetsp:Transcript_45274/g.81426  ORF Transcript_45274/g.81426 Transcript_45274/m.81426 type:complete len:451 (-) Transcript_45274:58-1410(-)